MSKKGIWLVVGTALVIIGTVILVLTAHTVNWNFNGFSTTVYNDVDQAFDSIFINTDTADIEFLPSDLNLFEEDYLNNKIGDIGNDRQRNI